MLDRIFRDAVHALLYFIGGFMAVSSVIYIMDGDERWFSRMALSVITMGLALLISALEEAR